MVRKMVVAQAATCDCGIRDCGSGAIAWALSDSAKVGTAFAGIFTVALMVLLALASGALWAVRFSARPSRLRIPSSLRHGLANLYRPGNQSRRYWPPWEPA